MHLISRNERRHLNGPILESTGSAAELVTVVIGVTASTPRVLTGVDLQGP